MGSRGDRVFVAFMAVIIGLFIGVAIGINFVWYSTMPAQKEFVAEIPEKVVPYLLRAEYLGQISLEEPLDATGVKMDWPMQYLPRYLERDLWASIRCEPPRCWIEIKGIPEPGNIPPFFRSTAFGNNLNGSVSGDAYVLDDSQIRLELSDNGVSYIRVPATKMAFTSSDILVYNTFVVAIGLIIAGVLTGLGIILLVAWRGNPKIA